MRKTLQPSWCIALTAMAAMHVSCARAAWAAPQQEALLDLSQAPQTVVLLGDLPRNVAMGAAICAITPNPGIKARAQFTDHLQIDPEKFSPTWVQVELAQPAALPSRDANPCQQTLRKRLFFWPAGQRPTFEAAITILPESRTAQVRLAENSDAALDTFRFLTAEGTQVQATSECPGKRACAISLEDDAVRRLLAPNPSLAVLLWPTSVPLQPGDELPSWRLPNGSWIAPAAFAHGDMKPRFEFLRPLISATQVSGSDRRVLITSPYTAAIADVTCRQARCSLTAAGIELFAIENSALHVNLRLDLKPNVVRITSGRPSNKENIELEVVRCGMHIPENTPLLSGAVYHRYFIAVARECFNEMGKGSAAGDTGQVVAADGPTDIAIETWPPTSAYVQMEAPSINPAWRVFEIIFDKVPEKVQRVRVNMIRRDAAHTTVGTVSIPVSNDFTPVGVMLQVADLGFIDFIPANRAAQIDLAFADPSWTDQIVVENRPGFYQIDSPNREEVSTDASAATAPLPWRIKAVSRASGNVALRLGYRPKALQDFLGSTTSLVSFDTDARFSLRAINLPLPLNPTKKESPHEGFVRVVCYSHNKEIEVPVGTPTPIAYRDRFHCQVIIERAKIPESAGVQRLHLRSNQLDQIIAVSHRSDPLSVTLSPQNKREFDLLALSVAHEYEGGHYDFAPRQNIGAEATYQIILGDRRFRVSAGTALPTGLFRFGAQQDRGSVPLSAGGVARFVWLTQEGGEFPIGIEMGLLGTGLSEEPHLSLVAGLGFSVPVLNANTSLQTSFNLHAWMEYSPTRRGPGEQPWAFLFGPSFAIGKFSTTL